MMQWPAWSYGFDEQTRNASLPAAPFTNVARGTAAPNSFRPGNLGVLPSAQQLRDLAPTERAGLQGYYESELGVPWEDVQWQSDRLRPRGGFASAPAWSVF